MRFTPRQPPRKFRVGRELPVEIADCGHLELAANEQVTLTTESGAEYDVARKSWGFYATPSLNGRLASFGLRAVLVKSPLSKYYVWLIERGKEAEFDAYMNAERHVVIAWLDSDAALTQLERKLRDD